MFQIKVKKIFEVIDSKNFDTAVSLSSIFTEKEFK